MHARVREILVQNKSQLMRKNDFFPKQYEHNYYELSMKTTFVE